MPEVVYYSPALGALASALPCLGPDGFGGENPSNFRCVSINLVRGRNLRKGRLFRQLL